MVGGSQVAAVGLGQLAGNGQSQAAATFLAGAGFVGAVKTFEKVRQAFRRNACAAVVYS